MFWRYQLGLWNTYDDTEQIGGKSKDTESKHDAWMCYCWRGWQRTVSSSYELSLLAKVILNVCFHSFIFFISDCWYDGIDIKHELISNSKPNIWVLQFMYLRQNINKSETNMDQTNKKTLCTTFNSDNV